MRFAKIVKGVVVNVVKADDETARKQNLIAAPDHIGVGDLYDKDAKVFSKAPAVDPVAVLELTKGQLTARVLLLEREIQSLKDMVSAL